VMGLSQVVWLIIGGYMADNMGKNFMIKLSALLAMLTAIMFVTSTIYQLNFAVLVLYSALSGLAVLGGGAIFSLMSEKYPDSLAPAAIGYSEVFGIMASFAAPWSMGAVIQASGGSFTAAFVLFALVEAAFLVLLMVLARDTVSRPTVTVALRRMNRDGMLRLNLKSTFLCCRAAVPFMMERHRGSIVNVSSGRGATPAPERAHYAAAKAGVMALTRCAAIEAAPFNVRVNAILPGLMNTPMAVKGLAQARGVPEEEVARQRDAQVPLGAKMGTAWDVAYAALFLASDEAKFITGVLLPVDGGQSARIG